MLDGANSVVAAALTTLAQLARVSPEAVRPHAHELLPVAVDAMRKQVTTVRCAALAATSALVRATGEAEDAYVQFPSLLPMLLQMMHVDQTDPALRIELTRALGVLGARDPATQTQQALLLQRESAKATKEAKKVADAGKLRQSALTASAAVGSVHMRTAPATLAVTGAVTGVGPAVALPPTNFTAPAAIQSAQSSAADASKLVSPTEPEYYHAVAILALEKMCAAHAHNARAERAAHAHNTRTTHAHNARAPHARAPHATARAAGCT